MRGVQHTNRRIHAKKSPPKQSLEISNCDMKPQRLRVRFARVQRVSNMSCIDRASADRAIPHEISHPLSELALQHGPIVKESVRFSAFGKRASEAVVSDGTSSRSATEMRFVFFVLL